MNSPACWALIGSAKPPTATKVSMRDAISSASPRLCAAIVDRLTFGGNIIETGTDSFRLAQARARGAQQAINADP